MLEVCAPIAPAKYELTQSCNFFFWFDRLDSVDATIWFCRHFNFDIRPTDIISHSPCHSQRDDWKLARWEDLSLIIDLFIC
jgi:hypothetical protein